MDNKQKTALGVAIAATLGAGAAGAASISATLVTYATYSNNGASAGNIASSTATWAFDDVTGIITQTGGVLNARFTTAPTSTLFRHTSTGLSLGAGGAASATTWSCIEGNFGTGVGASICGNYNFGQNFVNDTTLTYSGSTVSRTMGGDDNIIGDPQSVADLNGINTVSWVGTTLTLSNAICTTNFSGAQCATFTDSANKGYKLVFNAPPVPVPAAAWLVGPAVLAAGRFARRRKAS